RSDRLVGELGAEGARLREPVLPREGVGEPAVEGDPAVGEAGEVAEVVVEPLEPGEEPLDDEGDDAADVVEGEVAVARDGAVDLPLRAGVALEGGVELERLEGGEAPL